MRDPLPGSRPNQGIEESFSHVTTTSAYSPDQCLFHYYRDFTTVADRGDNRFVKPARSMRAKEIKPWKVFMKEQKNYLLRSSSFRAKKML